MELFEKFSLHQRWLPLMVACLALHGCTTQPSKPETPEPTSKPTQERTSLLGEWCHVKKKRITTYTINEGKLRIISGRSGRRYHADLTCNDAYTECKAQTIRGWGSPVTELMRLDDNSMHLTRIWGGAWKDKTYDFTYTPCPKW